MGLVLSVIAWAAREVKRVVIDLEHKELYRLPC